jgi:hypothetical protein
LTQHSGGIPVADWSGFRKASAAELKRAATYTEADKQRAREAARVHGGPRFAALLDAEPVKAKKVRTRGGGPVSA